MGKRFSDEVAYIPKSIKWATEQETQFLANSLGSLAGKNVICIGSGGSTTAAMFLAQQHEIKYGLISKSMTPCEFLLQKNFLDNTAVVLISAEGKNQDILAIARKVAFLEVPSVAIVLSADSPLALQCESFGSIVMHSFPMAWGKDGYLATNSLISFLILIAKAYAIDSVQELLKIIDQSWICLRRNLLRENHYFLEELVQNPFLTVLYGFLGKVGAVDIESKLSEAALFPCEITDYRQFAHGRHLQLTTENRKPCIVAFHSSSDRELCYATLANFPENIPILIIELPEDHFLASIISVIDAILITEALSEILGVDVGQPTVSEFGRRMHHLEVKKLLPITKNEVYSPIQRKYLIKDINHNLSQTAELAFFEALKNSTIKAIISDFDGTFCNTEFRHKGLDLRLVSTLEQLANDGITICFATGRGRSLYRDLRSKLNPSVWSKIYIGYYSGSIITRLDHPIIVPPLADKRFELLIQWLTENGLLALESTQVTFKAHGGQLSIQTINFCMKSKIAANIRYWLKENNLTTWRVFFSGHSIDVLTEHVGKSVVVTSIATELQCCPLTEILRIGDSGDVEGNDFELLNEGLGLSVDKISSFKEKCWNLLPSGYRGVTGTLFYLKGLKSNEDGRSAKFDTEIINEFNKAIWG